MNDHAGQSISVWIETATLPPFSTLAKNEHADVCIVGAGIAGLTTAYLLGRAGRSVIVLDDGPIVSGETERTTAHLATALDGRYSHLERLHGEGGARLAAASHAAAIDKIEEIVVEEKIDCDFERLDGFLFAPPGESCETLERELAASHRSGLTGTEMVARAPLGSFESGPALRFPRQAQFHPLKYSAVCPHLGGIAAWNHSEESWDCPCHGSRFDKFGKVLNGPAITNLLPATASNPVESGKNRSDMVEATLV